jgi:hypothetical protein
MTAHGGVEQASTSLTIAIEHEGRPWCHPVPLNVTTSS